MIANNTEYWMNTKTIKKQQIPKHRTVKITYWVFGAFDWIRIQITLGFGKSCKYEFKYIRFNKKQRINATLWQNQRHRQVIVRTNIITDRQIWGTEWKCYVNQGVTRKLQKHTQCKHRYWRVDKRSRKKAILMEALWIQTDR